MRNILLCGFMGCGKTTVGKLLAQLLRREYLDLDALIEEQAGKPIPRIFSEEGEAAFRALEHEAVVCLARRIGCVVATGGGAMTAAENVQAVSPDDIVVFLDADFSTCYGRIRHSSRPLVQQNTAQALEELFERRRESYLRAASLTVDADRPPRSVAEEIAARLPVCRP